MRPEPRDYVEAGEARRCRALPIKDIGGDGNTSYYYRYATLNGVNVALPTIGASFTGWQYGTAVGNSVAAQGSNASNAKYDDLLAIWDAYNGTGAGAFAFGMEGTPPGWKVGNYWSASGAGGTHDHLQMGYGSTSNHIADDGGALVMYSDGIERQVPVYVALQVL